MEDKAPDPSQNRADQEASEAPVEILKIPRSQAAEIFEHRLELIKKFLMNPKETELPEKNHQQFIS